MASTSYAPGVCNINDKEAARRRLVGNVGVAATGAGLVALHEKHAPAWTGMLLALPATLATTGHLQASNHFCVAHGAAGTRFTGAQQETVVDPEARAADKARARRMTAQALALGTLAGLAATLLLRRF